MKLKAYDVVVSTMVHGNKKVGVTAYDETMAEIRAFNIVYDNGFIPIHVVSVTELACME